MSNKLDKNKFPYQLPYTYKDFYDKIDINMDMAILGVHIPLILNMCDRYKHIPNRFELALKATFTALETVNIKKLKVKNPMIYVSSWIKIALESQ